MERDKQSTLNKQKRDRHKQTGRQTDKQTDRQAGRQAGTETDRSTELGEVGREEGKYGRWLEGEGRPAKRDTLRTNKSKPFTSVTKSATALSKAKSTNKWTT